MNTATQPLTPNTHAAFAVALGQLHEGGFFTGIISLNGQRFGIAVAPKALGETKGRWGNAGTRLDANHAGDGMANTEAMLAAGSPIAKWARDLDINGHNDWYIPSRDELELIYRNLKPGDDENACSFRDGDNPSSVPPGQMYTDESPAQTAAAEFHAGGSEAMAEGWYWSSAQSSAYYAFVQDFSDGSQTNGRKASEWRVRAVRRFLIT